MQRDELAKLRSQVAASQGSAVESVPATSRWATPVREEQLDWGQGSGSVRERSRERSRESRREREERESSRERSRSQRRSSSQRSATRESDTAGIGETALVRDGARLRELRERPVAPEFGNSRLPQNETVSAHMGESGVVGVTRRSERRSRFTLVQPERTEAARDFGFGRDRDCDYDRDYDYGFDSSYDEPEQLEDEEVAFESDWGWQEDTRSRRDVSRTRRRMQVDGYESLAESRFRESIFTEEDLAPYGLPGAASRRRSVSAGLAAIPQAIGSALGGAGQLVASHLRGFAVMATMALLVFMLFTPVRNLYVAHRQLDRLQQTYDALLAENEQIRGELESLQTREGIENEARARGYVEVGETKVVVEGLPEEESTSLADTIGDVEVHEERAWYTVLFDTVFGYDPEA